MEGSNLTLKYDKNVRIAFKTIKVINRYQDSLVHLVIDTLTVKLNCDVLIISGVKKNIYDTLTDVINNYSTVIVSKVMIIWRSDRVKLESLFAFHGLIDNDYIQFIKMSILPADDFQYKVNLAFILLSNTKATNDQFMSMMSDKLNNMQIIFSDGSFNCDTLPFIDAGASLGRYVLVNKLFSFMYAVYVHNTMHDVLVIDTDFINIMFDGRMFG